MGPFINPPQTSAANGKSKAAWVLGSLLLLIGAGWLAAQAPGTKEEIEDPQAPRPKAPFRVGDEGTETPSSPLAQEALRANHFLVKGLFQQLKVPHDLVTIAGRALMVQPVGPFLGNRAPLEGELSLQGTDLNGKPGPVVPVKSVVDITRFEPYEKIALRQVDRFLQSTLDQEPATSPKHLPRREMLRSADRTLEAVLDFHKAARERKVRTGPGWDAVGQELRDRLQTVQVEWLNVLARDRDWAAVAALARRVAETNPLPLPVLTAVIAVRLRQVEDQLGGEAALDAAILLGQLEKELQDRKEPEFKTVREKAATLRDLVRTKAGDGLSEARRLLGRKDREGAIDLLQKVRQMDPATPGLDDFRRELALSQEQVLNVGVRQLPEFFTPAAAVTDAERQAGDLIFESLVRPITDRAGRQHYEPVLAQHLPRFLPLGRQFQLREGARWSDGTAVTSNDISGTVGRLKQRHRPGFVPEWDDLLKEVHFTDQSQVSLYLKRGWLDPLSLMSFKILPDKHSNRLDDPAFARQPVGSGPFAVVGPGPAADRTVFLEANKMRQAPPLLQGIRFKQPGANPLISDFRNGRLHMLLDASPTQVQELNEAGLSFVTIKTLTERRVYFLAVNHTKSDLKKLELRRGIAAAIDREQILTTQFRGNLSRAVHRGLTGPYPPDSWASNRDLEKTPLYNPLQAKVLMKDARLIPGQKLNLKYPDDQPEVEAACKLIRQQIMASTDALEIVLQKVSPQELKKYVEQKHDFDLAYYSWDYPDESYWLWPLFDPRGTEAGGLNYMRCQDTDLQAHLRQAMEHRAFAAVQRLTHQVHQDFVDRMPFIPLWQLDRHVAIHQDVVKVVGNSPETIVPLWQTPIDPHTVFAGAETWKLLLGGRE